MKAIRTFIIISITVLVIATTTVYALGNYQIDWWTVDGGSGISQSSGGDYALQGTIGQFDSGTSQGGEYHLDGGFWANLRDWVSGFLIHLPLVLR